MTAPPGTAWLRSLPCLRWGQEALPSLPWVCTPLCGEFGSSHWPEGVQLVAAGQLWYSVSFSFLVFHLIPFLLLLCVAPSPSPSDFAGAFDSLSLFFHLLCSILVPRVPWSPGPSTDLLARGKSWLVLWQLPISCMCVLLQVCLCPGDERYPRLLCPNFSALFLRTSFHS